jgi:NAD(P)-dependent dehydrogenase (short-subunit alcohol dehydrogenase family)
MQGKTCLVTGATSGIGKATAEALARAGATVLIAARDESRGQATAEEIRRAAPQGSVEVLVADLAVQEDVRRLAAQVIERHDRLDVLINNAGGTRSDRKLTPDGLEVTFATNHLAPFLLTNLLLDLLRRSAPARIVGVSSELHRRVREIPWDNLQGEQSYSGTAQYGLTKLMNVLFTYELARRLEGSGVTANCLSPGFTRTGLGRDTKGGFGLFLKLAGPFMISPEKGARLSVHLATAPEVAEVTGAYFRGLQPKESSPLSHDEAAQKRLWELSAKLTSPVGEPAG